MIYDVLYPWTKIELLRETFGFTSVKKLGLFKIFKPSIESMRKIRRLIQAFKSDEPVSKNERDDIDPFCFF